jgi:hypothetical protein
LEFALSFSLNRIVLPAILFAGKGKMGGLSPEYETLTSAEQFWLEFQQLAR